MAELRVVTGVTTCQATEMSLRQEKSISEHVRGDFPYCLLAGVRRLAFRARYSIYAILDCRRPPKCCVCHSQSALFRVCYNKATVGDGLDQP